MVEEHVEGPMIQQAIVGLTEAEEEVTLRKIGCKPPANRGNMAIKLPALNMALVEVHQELARVCLGVKDMAYKNKQA